MARRHSRKSHRRSKRHSRKSHRRSKTHRRQHGGGACAAMPLNRMNFQQQGGMAPIAAGDDYLLDAGARATAGVGSLDASFAELPSVIPRQAGGRRHRRSARRKSHKKSHRRSHKHRRGSRKQHGGSLAAMNGPSMLVSDMAKTGSNPQFLDEGAVNSHYGVKGPQA
jgi:hypothetical protein